MTTTLKRLSNLHKKMDKIERELVSELPLPLPQSVARALARRNGVVFKSSNVDIGRHSILGGNVVVGDHCSFGKGIYVWAEEDRGKIIIEDNVTIGASSEIRGETTTLSIAERFRWQLDSAPPRASICRVCEGTYIGRFNRLDSTGDLHVGKGCFLTDNIRLYTHKHDIPSRNQSVQRGRVIPKSVFVSDDVFIGVGAVVLSGVSIGEGAVVGAGAVVTNDVEPYSFVAGVPARKIGERPP